jgi:nucleoside-diphosphate-sugar epimerase
MANQITDDDLILVTGATGYIACHIIKQLLDKGYRVRGTVRSIKDEKKISPLRKLSENPRHPLDLVEADLDKEDGWANAVKGCSMLSSILICS